MALRDLVADHRKIAEETIEKVVAPYIRYDPGAYKIVWRPEGKSLGNDARILVFLVATLGWQYVLDEASEVPTKPADLERELGIAGGTLRPILKKLKDGHLLVVADGHYRVQLANLDSIAAEITGEGFKVVPKAATRRQARTRQRNADNKEAHSTSDSGGTKKRRRSPTGELKTFLIKWIGDGFFNEARTLSVILDRYHEHGVITKQTSLSGLMLEAVREGLVARAKLGVGGKQMWAYTARQ